MTQTAILEENEVETLASPGQRLKAAREAKALSQADIAAKLKLHNRWIEAIEFDRYDEMPSMAYTRGYMQAYAKIVEVPVKEIMPEFSRRTSHFESSRIDYKPTLTPVKWMPLLANSHPKRRRRRILRYVSLLVATGIVIMVVVAWWQSQNDKPHAVAEITAPFSLQNNHDTVAAPLAIKPAATTATDNSAKQE